MSVLIAMLMAAATVEPETFTLVIDRPFIMRNMYQEQLIQAPTFTCVKGSVHVEDPDDGWFVMDPNGRRLDDAYGHWTCTMREPEASHER